MLKRTIAELITILTKIVHSILSIFVSEEKLLKWKPIHLCWWFERNGFEVPKYFIAGFDPPVVVTNTASNVGTSTARLNGNVTSQGSATVDTRGFAYSSSDTTPEKDEGGTVTTVTAGTGGTGIYYVDVSSLSPGTTYYFQAWATNSKGTAHGGVLTFTTENFSESPSVSPSSSVSPSASASPSISPSASASPSISPSASESPSPSPGWSGYSRGSYATLPTDDADLETVYSSQDETDVGTDDETRVTQTSGSGLYAIHQYKNYIGSLSAVTITWNGQSDLAPASNAVYLQVYNYNTPGWEAGDSNSLADADTDFNLTTDINDTANYINGGIITWRIYQQGPP